MSPASVSASLFAAASLLACFSMSFFVTASSTGVGRTALAAGGGAKGFPASRRPAASAEDNLKAKGSFLASVAQVVAFFADFNPEPAPKGRAHHHLHFPSRRQ